MPEHAKELLNRECDDAANELQYLDDGSIAAGSLRLEGIFAIFGRELRITRQWRKEWRVYE